MAEGKYGRLRIFHEPQCLVATGEGQGLVLEDRVLEELHQIEEDLVVVGIAGPYRTGKSFLLNRLAGQNKGFPLGSTIQAKTKGIWIWCRPHPDHSDRILLLMDTEGLGDIEKGSTEHDVWILTLSVLLSSTLVYNILSVMNEDAIEKMNLVSEIAKKLMDSTDAKPDSVGFPIFVLSLRDFFLSLELDGVEVSADDYLENCLHLRPDNSEENKKYNATRMCIRDCFPERKCFTFERPGKRSVLRKLETIAYEELDVEFREQSAEFCSYIYSTSPVKRIDNSVSVNGRRFVQMLESYIGAIQGGAIPSIRDTVTAMAEIENQRAVEEAGSMYMTLMMQSVDLPTTDCDSLQEIHCFCMDEAVAIFRGRAMQDDDAEFATKLIIRLTQEFQNFESMNAKASEERCMAVLKELNKEIGDKLAAGTYFRNGGFREYHRDVERLEEEFQLQPGLGLQAYEVLYKFLDGKWSESHMISTIDNNIKEQELRLARYKREVRKLEREAEEAREATEERKREIKLNRERLERQLEEEERRGVQDMRNLHAQLDSKMERELKSQGDRIGAQFSNQLGALRRELNNL